MSCGPAMADTFIQEHKCRAFVENEDVRSSIGHFL